MDRFEIFMEKVLIGIALSAVLLSVVFYVSFTIQARGVDILSVVGETDAHVRRSSVLRRAELLIEADEARMHGISIKAEKIPDVFDPVRTQ